MQRFAILITLMFFITTFVVTLHAEESNTDVEPNNYKEYAVTIDGYTINGHVGYGSDFADWYVLDGQPTEEMTITLIYDSWSYDIDVNIYSGEELAGNLITPDSPDEEIFNVTGRCYIEVFPYDDSEGDYEILINGGRPERVSDSERQSECGGASEIEPNDLRMQATEMDDFYLEGFICDGDIDWYITHGQEGVNPKITIEYDDSECDIDVVVYSDYTVANTLSSLTSPDSENFTVPGTCWIKVFSWNGTGEYIINIEPETSGDIGFFDDVEWVVAGDGSTGENPEPLVPVTEDGQWVVGITGEVIEGEEDWFTIDRASIPTDRYIFTLDYDASTTDIDLEITYDSNQSSIAAINGIESPDSVVAAINSGINIRIYPVTNAGEYRLLIQPESATSNQPGPSGSANDPCQGYSEIEPNNEKDVADLITGLEIQGHACDGDVDWYVLDGQEGTGPWFEISYSPPTDIDIEIWDDDERVGMLQSSGSPDRGRFEVKGKCYLKVWAHNGEGDYRITITPDTAPPDPSETVT